MLFAIVNWFSDNLANEYKISVYCIKKLTKLEKQTNCYSKILETICLLLLFLIYGFMLIYFFKHVNVTNLIISK